MVGDTLSEAKFQHLQVKRDGPVVEVTIARTEARNALDSVLMRELTDLARLLHRRADVQAVILTGGDTYFSAGADLKASAERLAAPTLLDAREAVMAGPDLCRAWEEIEAVTIVAVEGYCIGGAFALALACDFRILGDGAYFRLPEIPLGMNMSWNSIPRLVTLVGPSRTKQIVMFGEAIDASTCHLWGLADEVTTSGEAATRARAWATKISSLPPIPVRMTKGAVNAQATMNHYPLSFMDRDQFLLTTRTNDFVEGRRAFLEKRSPVFRGD